MYRNEDDFWDSYYEARQAVEEKAMQYAEEFADEVGIYFESEKDREAYVDRIYAEYMSEAGY